MNGGNYNIYKEYSTSKNVWMIPTTKHTQKRDWPAFGGGA